MPTSVYTYISGPVGAIETAEGVVALQQSGLFQQSEYQAAISDGCVLTAGPASSPAPSLGAPTVVAGSAGTPNGTYKCAVTFVTAAGETKIGAEATITVTSQQISWSNLPVGSAASGVTARKLYRTAAGGSSGAEKLVTTINDNTTTTFTDNIADGSLGAVVPTSDTSAVAGGTGSGTVITAPTVTGAKAGNAALASLLSALSSKGYINDATTA